MEKLRNIKKHHLGIGGAIFVLGVVVITILLSSETSFANANLKRVSVGYGGMESNSNSYHSALAGDGEPCIPAPGVNCGEGSQYVTFGSYANNLVSGDINNHPDVFVRNQWTEEVERISVNEAGEGGNNRSEDPHISRDGRYVVFESYADNLVSPDENDWIPDSDIFLYDRQTSKMRRVSEVKTEENYGAEGVLGSYDPFVSTYEDEHQSVVYVAFMSYANNIVANDSNNHSDIYLYTLSTNKDTGVETENIIKISPEYFQYGARVMYFGNAYFPSISGNNRYITYTASSKATTGFNPSLQVYVYDLVENETQIASLTWNNKIPTQNSSMSSISDDGRYVAFSTYAILTSEDVNKVDDIYIRDMVEGVTTMVAVPKPVNDGEYYGDSNFPSISSGGRFVTFTSQANNLTPGDSNGVADVFVYDTVNKTFEVVSVNGNGEIGDRQSYRSSFSPSGKFVVFESDATNLVVEDTNKMRDIFVATPTTTEINQDFTLEDGGVLPCIPAPGIDCGDYSETGDYTGGIDSGSKEGVR